jgi:hypothetical protein
MRRKRGGTGMTSEGWREKKEGDNSEGKGEGEMG